MIKKLLFVCLLGICLPAFAKQAPLKITDRFFLTQNNISSAFDPFIDYGEFQDNVTEEESIIFFQHGRSLTLSLLGGYEAVVFNMNHIYGDAPFIFGMAIGFFFDLRFAFQVSGFFPYKHYDSLLRSMSQFAQYSINLKYYFNQQYLNENASFFNPYVVFGPFWIRIKSNIPRGPTVQRIVTPGNTTIPPQDPNQNPSLSREEIQTVPTYSAFGAKIGLGCEIPLIKQSFMGLEISYLYTHLQHENQDLSGLESRLPTVNYNPNQNLIERRQFPNRPQVRGFRFFGDLIDVIVFFGINF